MKVIIPVVKSVGLEQTQGVLVGSNMEWIENGFLCAVGVCLFLLVVWVVMVVLVSILTHEDEGAGGEKVSSGLWGRLCRVIPHADEHGNPVGWSRH